MATKDRPLSPHLQIYRWQWTMALSILHRATGVALAVGTLLLVWWLVSLATGAPQFANLQGFLNSQIGKICLIGWSWALFYHLANGMRHLFWDAGKGYSLPVAQASGYIVFVTSVLLTGALWLGWFGALV
ncbi:MAG: succinate dehydrogenase, cytochrome b556 subunit [Proteobacteria bacterium]|nr:succinate dehydrogenase, cytochrome b556 subunit [Pseudomonadota bacterium]